MKKKDYIEELIEKNREGLNANEPPRGHLRRFKEKLDQQNKQRRSSLKLVWKIAAAAVFAFLVVNQGILWFASDKGHSGEDSSTPEWTLASVSSEYEEVEFYYTNAINGGLEQLEQMAEEGFISEKEQQMMETELKEFEAVYSRLRDDLSASPNDERVIQAMLDYYQTKLNMITMIVNKLQEVKQKKYDHHENEI